MSESADLRAPVQIDWIRLEDQLASARLLLDKSATGVGVLELAHVLREHPSTLRNRLAYRDDKQPTARMDHACFFLDLEFRRAMLGLSGETLARPPDLDPEDAMREAMTYALAGEFGNEGARKFSELYRRMRKGSR